MERGSAAQISNIIAAMSSVNEYFANGRFFSPYSTVSMLPLTERKSIIFVFASRKNVIISLKSKHTIETTVNRLTNEDAISATILSASAYSD